MNERKLTLYRDDSTVQVTYDHVKAVFWTASNTVLVISQFIDIETGGHRYIHWPRERFCWFKDEPVFQAIGEPTHDSTRNTTTS